MRRANDTLAACRPRTARCANLLATIAVSLLVGAGCEPMDRQEVDRTGVDIADEIDPNEVTTEDIRRESEEALDTTAAWLEQQKAELQADAEKRLAAVRRDLQLLREKASGYAEETREAVDQRIEQIDKQLEAAQQRVEESATVMAENWNEFQKDAMQAIDELEKNTRKALSTTWDEDRNIEPPEQPAPESPQPDVGARL